MNVQFFWDKKHRKLNRSRFNLLLLDYGEYFLEDFSIYHFPLPTNDLKQSFEIQDSLKIQGRLKLNSRSLIFEPNDVRYPLLKFPYKYMLTDLEKFHLTPLEYGQLSIQVNGFFTFLCSQYHEMKAHNKVGPYRVIEYMKSKEDSSQTIFGYRLLFALVYADLQLFLVKVEQFRHIFNMSEKLGSIIASQHLKPFLENALISTFDTSNLVDFHERFLIQIPISVRKIKPLVANPGTLVVTELRIYFQPAQLNNIGDTTQHFELKKVLKVYKRRHMLRSIGLEFILQDGSSYFFVFESMTERDKLFDILHSQENLLTSKYHVSLPDITRKWQRNEMTNFEYLMYLNNEAGRTSNDLTQYPVFPHIIADYKSRKLNLENPKTFRDLSKPIGALNLERLKYFQERFYSMPPADLTNGIPPPFLYGTHYSTPGYVLYYLVRVAPEYMLCLQNGRFDASDRMFHSIADTWESCLTNPTDLKELIPEFFTGSGEFLLNFDDLDLGHRHSGERLHDVELPSWAESPRDFIRKHIKALESEYVSNHLHEWIDLIFGYKQQGEAAIQADNLFYYLTYEGAVNLETVKDVRERAALESQIQEFGQTPRQLFQAPHPSRKNINGAVVVTDSVNQAFEDYRQASSPLKKNISSDTITTASVKSAISSKEDIRGERKSNERSNNNGVQSIPSESSLSSKSAKKAVVSMSSVTPPPIPKDVIEDVNDNIAIMHLGEDFRLEVERHLSNETTRAISPINALASGSGKGGSGFAVSPLTVMSDMGKGNSNGTTLSRAVDVTKMRLFPSEAYYWHSKAVTGVAMRVQMNSIDTLTNRRKVTATVCSIGKDSVLKVVKVDQDLNPMDLEKKAGAAIDKESVVRTQCTISRSYSASGSSLSSVILSAEGSKVIFSSWDNHLYAYSIASASSIGKRYAHYDCVTSIAVDKNHKWLLSGSLDASVKLWSLKQGTSNIFSPGATTEFTEHDYPVHCVAINAEGDYGAAGAEDGTLTVWDLNSQLTLCSYSCSGDAKRPVTAVKWLPIEIEYYKHPSFASHKIVISTEDGGLLCLDQNGKLFAGGSIDSPVLSLDTDGRIIIGGCQDGSVRVWIMSNGQMQQIQKYTKAHSGGVTAISLGKPVEDISVYVSGTSATSAGGSNSVNNGSSSSGSGGTLSELLVSGSDDCSIRIWRIWYDQ